jgi:uncharacterized protein DUF6916
MLESASRNSFAEQLHTIFYLHVEGRESVPLELYEVSEPLDPKRSPGMEQFSLLFRGPRVPFYPQGVYTLEHKDLGTGELFIVPVGPDSHGMCYQVVLSRVEKASP